MRMGIFQSKRGQRSKAVTILLYFFMILLAIICVYPYIWVAISGFKTNSEIFTSPFSLPEKWQIQNYFEAWTVGHLGEYYGNTILVTAISVLFYLPLVILAAYPLAKIQFVGKKLILPFLLFGLAVPFQAYMLSLYTVLRDLRALNTVWGIALPLIGQQIPFGIFMMRSFFVGIPDGIIDAARIDGATERKVLLRVLIPMAKSAVISLAIFQMVFAWNAFMIPLLYANTGDLRTLTLGLMYYSGEYTTNYSWTMSGTIIVSLPLILVFLIFRRGFIQGIAAGSIK